MESDNFDPFFIEVCWNCTNLHNWKPEYLFTALLSYKYELHKSHNLILPFNSQTTWKDAIVLVETKGPISKHTKDAQWGVTSRKEGTCAHVAPDILLWWVAVEGVYYISLSFLHENSLSTTDLSGSLKESAQCIRKQYFVTGTSKIIIGKCIIILLFLEC